MQARGKFWVASLFQYGKNSVLPRWTARRSFGTDCSPDAMLQRRPWIKRGVRSPVYLTDEGLFDIPVGFFTYHGFLTIMSSSRIISLDNLVFYNHLRFLCACFYFPNFPSTCTNFSQLCMLHPPQQNMWNSGYYHNGCFYGYADGAHSSNSCGYYQHLTRWPANLSQPLHPNFIPSESGK
jgi:hypothetical protein